MSGTILLFLDKTVFTLFVAAQCAATAIGVGKKRIDNILDSCAASRLTRLNKGIEWFY